MCDITATYGQARVLGNTYRILPIDTCLSTLMCIAATVADAAPDVAEQTCIIPA